MNYILSICTAVTTSVAGYSYTEEAPITSPLNIYTHGFSSYALERQDGSIEGVGVDALSCALGEMGVKYQLNIVPLARARRLFDNKTLDLWFPTYHWDGRDNEQYIIGKLGTRKLSWYTLPDSKLQPDHPDFKVKARLGTFAKSGPEAILHQNGYKLSKTSDDENQLILWLFEGKIDALLTLDFRNLLSPRLKKRFGELTKTYYETYRMGFEIAQHFDQKHPAFKPEFTKYLRACELQSEHQKHNREADR